MPGYILSTQGDRMAMAHSVEGRFPFLDYRVAEFAANIPPRLKMKGLNEKHLLKRAFRDLIPEQVDAPHEATVSSTGCQEFLHSRLAVDAS